MNIVVDAHFTQLVLSPAAHPLLVELHQVIQNQVHFIDELISLEAILTQLEEKCALPKSREVGVYCIEVIEF